ncbi:tRNA(Met) cytidine acetyltransferase TmcA [Pasteurellaceae bacterium 22721_9_1]
MLPARQLEVYCAEKTPHFVAASDNLLVIDASNIHKARNLLGQEFDQILFDAREGINLDALAMAAGTLRANGRLILWLNDQSHIDQDSLRWSGVETGIPTPNFQRHFQSLLKKYATVYQERMTCQSTFSTQCKGYQPTTSQSHIIEQILKQQADIFILTAKRGRGKSALVGFLAQQLYKHSTPIILTAPNKSAVKILQDVVQMPLEFIAPDELIQQIERQPEQFQQHWLLIDEAAMLPIDSLNRLTHSFKHIVISTTVHSYEGTGRGFLIKFLANLNRTYQAFQLVEPLRWQQNDPLEQFIDELLLLEAEDKLEQPSFNPQSAVQFQPVLQSEIVQRITDFYGLLTLAHYRTSPLDLRRLLDAPHQQFWVAHAEENLIAGVWLVEEGNFNDELLVQQISDGERRPKGNLVAQKLAAYQHNGDFCRLNSLRISRIAVQPNWQRHGIGLQLIEQIAQDTPVDFLSVSFGYNQELAHFWQKCGFILVHIGDSKEASSGCFSAIALRAISEKGRQLVSQAEADFKRNFPLCFHPFSQHFSTEIHWQITPQDICHLQNFVKNYRTLSATVPAIRRLLYFFQHDVALLDQLQTLQDYALSQEMNTEKWGGKKHWLSQCRKDAEKLLKKSAMFFNIAQIF